MSSDVKKTFTKENLDSYLKDLAKEFRRLNGKEMPAEIILIGGAAILLNYGFREMTNDVDALIHASSVMKDAINIIGDRYDLPNGWLNTDFMKTSSYTPRIDEFSVYYKTFSNIMQIRTISGEYLIAMKLRSGRKYKNDLSDIIGILIEHEKSGTPITLEKVDKAVTDLYGSWDDFPSDSRNFIMQALKAENYEELYSSIILQEQSSRNALLKFNNDYPDVMNETNVNEILNILKKKKKQ